MCYKSSREASNDTHPFQRPSAYNETQNSQSPTTHLKEGEFALAGGPEHFLSLVHVTHASRHGLALRLQHLHNPLARTPRRTHHQHATLGPSLVPIPAAEAGKGEDHARCRIGAGARSRRRHEGL